MNDSRSGNRRALGALDRAVLRKTARAEIAKREGVRSIAENLGMMGALGWLFVTPPLLLGFLGRWLDRALASGFQLTAVLVLVGVGVGGWLVWRRLRETGVLGTLPNGLPGGGQAP